MHVSYPQQRRHRQPNDVQKQHGQPQRQHIKSMYSFPAWDVQVGTEKRGRVVANASARKQTERLGTQRGPDQIQQGHATGFDFDLQCLDVFTFAQQQPRRHAQQQQHWRCHTPQQLNPKKDVAVRHVGKHAFEIDQVLAQHGNGPTDFKNGDKDGWPEEKRKKEKKKNDNE